MKTYRDTENGEILTESQLKAEFKTLKAEEPETCRTVGMRYWWYNWRGYHCGKSALLSAQP